MIERGEVVFHQSKQLFAEVAPPLRMGYKQAFVTEHRPKAAASWNVRGIRPDYLWYRHEKVWYDDSKK